MKKYFLLVLIVILLSGCEEDGNSFRQNKFEVEFGNYTNMTITIHDTVIVGSYNRPEFFFLDIDGDKIDDISFQSIVWGSPAIGGHPKTTIYCLHEDVELHGFLKNDTSFLNTNIRINNGANNIVEIYENLSVSCHRQDESDSILNITIDNFKLQTHEKSDEFSPEDLFRSDTIILTNDSYAYPVDRISISADTIKYVSRFFYNDCNVFPEDQICYLGLKIGEKKNKKLGWIKLSISNQLNVYLLESALQKN